jgi:hypothetical protein
MLVYSTLITKSTLSIHDKPEVPPTYHKYDLEFTGVQALRLAHLSVKDYLVSTGIKLSKAAFFTINANLANESIAQACFVYLLQPIFESGHCGWQELKNHIELWPLYHYATHL